VFRSMSEYCLVQIAGAEKRRMGTYYYQTTIVERRDSIGIVLLIDSWRLFLGCRL